MNRNPCSAAASSSWLVLALATLAQASAGASTRTAAFVVSVIVDSDCAISSTSALNFGHAGAHLGMNPRASFPQTDLVTRFNVTCSKNTRYTLSLDHGNTIDSTANVRLMAGASNGNTDKLQYQLYIDPAYSTVWGDGSSGNSGNVSGIGNGTPQTYTVYGRILDQSMPSPDLYSSMITASLTF